MNSKIAVVIPCYKVTSHILNVISRIDKEISLIYVIDDKCPDNSGDLVQRHCHDPRVRIIRHEVNLGVGGAVMSGYIAAADEGADIIVKVDGDGQMDPSLITRFTTPIQESWADYTKGNRFYDLTHIRRMPGVRLLGNAALSFLAKLSTGYWNLFDPTNGYTAIDSRLIKHLQLEKVSNRYFFETDMLFRLNTIKAVVVDIPMDAKYGDEHSNLKISKILGEFARKHVTNLGKRIFYNYFLRDMSAASFELIFGILLIVFSIIYGSIEWLHSIRTGLAAPLGSIMLAVVPFLTGLQFMTAFINHDVSNVPSTPISRLLTPPKKK
ncbi:MULTISPECIES: glycosyltransferase family 2 protein [Pseudomonas]|uniref:glycosyltransferase family 2 protein n=1 Tax=Pseudomonas TaxID=286 RepID=UPI0009DDA078|nr:MULTISPECIES: glycosyltransferase family 2 protein [Pseudomonas]MBH3431404.1 glycosyltransferase family 2 protein [Pseudomonas citronellolis]